MKYLHEKNPTYSLYFFRALLSFNFLKFHKQLNKYIITRQFDREGRYVQSIQQIGIGGVEIGPCSLLPTCSEQQIRLLGILSVKANINTFRNQQHSIVQQFKIGVNIIPNFQIRKYTPYLIKQNILACLKEILELNFYSEKQQINFITLNFNTSQLKELHDIEYCSMLSQIIQQTQKQIKTYNLAKKDQVKLYIELPKPNIQLLKHLKYLSQEQLLVLDDSDQSYTNDYVLQTKHKLILNQERISWSQFVGKIMDKTLI